MIWAGICHNKRTSIYFCNGTLDSVQSQHILATVLKEHIASDEILTQDNAPVHVSHSSNTWLNLNNIKTIDWPSRLPDLNPFENLWGILVRTIYARNKQYQNIIDLKNAIMKVWSKLESSEILNLTNSINDRF